MKNLTFLLFTQVSFLGPDDQLVFNCLPSSTLAVFACSEDISKTMQWYQMKFEILIANNDRKFQTRPMIYCPNSSTCSFSVSNYQLYCSLQ